MTDIIHEPNDEMHVPPGYAKENGDQPRPITDADRLDWLNMTAQGRRERFIVWPCGTVELSRNAYGYTDIREALDAEIRDQGQA